MVNRLIGSEVLITRHLSGGDEYDHPTGVAINQETGDAFISSQYGSIHKLTANGNQLIQL